MIWNKCRVILNEMHTSWKWLTQRLTLDMKQLITLSRNIKVYQIYKTKSHDVEKKRRMGQRFVMVTLLF